MLYLNAGDTRPDFDASAAQSRLREAHPEVFEALDLPKDRRDALHSNVPPCIEAVRVISVFLHRVHTWVTHYICMCWALTESAGNVP